MARFDFHSQLHSETGAMTHPRDLKNFSKRVLKLTKGLGSSVGTFELMGLTALG